MQTGAANRHAGASYDKVNGWGNLGKTMRTGVIGILIISVLFACAGCGEDAGCGAGICDPCTRHEDCCTGRCAPAYENDVISRETYLGDFCTDDNPETVCPTVPLISDPIVRFAWNPNSEPDLAGYRLYQSEQPGQYEGSAPVLEIPAGTETCQVGPLNPGTYFWVLTAFNESLRESGHSNEVSTTIE